MSQLIQMRQRIKAITTIRKITSAMRLISRSFHARMYRDRQHLHTYQQTLFHIFTTVNACTPIWDLPAYLQIANKPSKELYIIIGSQKGLCGSFNLPITHWIDRHVDALQQNDTDIIVLSKKINEYLMKYEISKASVLPELKLITLEKIVEMLLQTITIACPTYTRVVLVANSPKTFLSHEYKETQLIPFTTPQDLSQTQRFDYVQSHDPNLILGTLVDMHLRITLHSLLFESLLGEQAARFIAMDNATRNANNFLDTMKLQFNKMRQAKITKELTELAGAFEIQI